MHCASEPNCKLNISSFLTLAYPLDCLTCAKDITVSFVTGNDVGVGKLVDLFFIFLSCC